jgi:hypothetical protein
MSASTFQQSELDASTRVLRVPLLVKSKTFFSLEAETAAYEEALHQWVLDRCVFRDRAWGGIRALHNDYAVWCDKVMRDVPAGLPAFEKLLKEFCSFTTENGLIYGVLLREDWENWIGNVIE